MPQKITPPSSNPALLLMLDGDAVLQRLIATWPNAYRAGAKKQEQIVTWSKLTGLREVEVENHWRTLFENGFINRDGTIEQWTEKFLNGLAVARMPRTVLKKKEGAGGDQP